MMPTLLHWCRVAVAAVYLYLVMRNAFWESSDDLCVATFPVLLRLDYFFKLHKSTIHIVVSVHGRRNRWFGLL